jgi:UDP-sugar transporter A1/2/3
MGIISLSLLVLQNTANVLIMKQSRLTVTDPYLPTVAVAVTQCVKLFMCFGVIYCNEGGRSLAGLCRVVRANTLDAPRDALKVAVPAFVYTVQSNLIYVAVQNLSPGVFECTYQLKILTTAFFSVALLGRKLGRIKVAALFVLLCGAVLVQLDSGGSNASAPTAVAVKPMLGLAAALSATVTSGFAGVYFERILKTKDSVSLWVRNVQLGLFGFVIAFMSVFLVDGASVAARGVLQGFDRPIAWGVVLIQAGGGLLVALVMKYADNILKGFATSVAIIASSVFSVFLFDFHMNTVFALGAGLVIVAVFMYNKDALIADKLATACKIKKKKKKKKKKTQEKYELMENDGNDIELHTMADDGKGGAPPEETLQPQPPTGADGGEAGAPEVGSLSDKMGMGLGLLLFSTGFIMAAADWGAASPRHGTPPSIVAPPPRYDTGEGAVLSALTAAGGKNASGPVDFSLCARVLFGAVSPTVYRQDPTTRPSPDAWVPVFFTDEEVQRAVPATREEFGVDAVLVIHWTAAGSTSEAARERQHARKKTLLDKLQHLGMHTTFWVEQFDASDIGCAEIECLYPAETRRESLCQWHRLLGLGELSVTIKHAAAYWWMLSHGMESVLVLEDDAVLHDSLWRPGTALLDYMKAVRATAPGWGVLDSGGPCSPVTGFHPVDPSISTLVVSTKTKCNAHVMRCAHGYAIRRSAAAVVLRAMVGGQCVGFCPETGGHNESRRGRMVWGVHSPIDNFITYQSRTALPLYYMEPSPISQALTPGPLGERKHMTNTDTYAKCDPGLPPNISTAMVCADPISVSTDPINEYSPGWIEGKDQLGQCWL